MDEDETKDLDRFLARVSDVETAVLELAAAADQYTRTEAIKKVDAYLALEASKPGFNKTIINQNAYDEVVAASKEYDNPIDKDSFMSAIEEDARRRTADRKQSEFNASLVKEKANVAFKEGNYETAFWLYSEAIEVAKHLPELYTNRALTSIKLGRYEDSIDDSNIALRIDHKWVKAFVTKGNALRCQQKYDEAIASYKKILNVDIEKEKMVQDYVAQAEEEKRVDELEKAAQVSLRDKEPVAEEITKIITRLGTRVEIEHETKENMFVYYAGGFRLLAAHIEDEASRTSFRMAGGYKILAAKPYLRDVLLKKTFSFGQQSDFACAVLIAIQAACTGCPENTDALLEEPMMPEIMMNLLESGDKQVKHAAMVCFYEFAWSPETVDRISKKFKAPVVLTLLLNKDTLKLKILNVAVACVSRLANSKRFQQDIVHCFNSVVLQLFQKFINEISHNQRKELPKCLECLNKFTVNNFLHQMMATNVQLWESCYACIDRCVHIMDQSTYRDLLLLRMLELMEVLILHKGTETVQQAPRLGKVVLPLMNSSNFVHVGKALVVITRTMERSKESVKMLHSSAGLVFVKKIYRYMKHEDMSVRTHALKIMCYCGQADLSTLRNAPKFDKKYNILRHILDTDDAELDSINQGHCALLLGYLSQIPGGMDPIIESDDTCNVVKTMLNLVRDSKNNNTRYNCCIALGRMSSNDARILGELRRLDGINILSRYKPPYEYLMNTPPSYMPTAE